MSQLGLEGLISDQPSQRSQIVASLACFRRDWQEMVNDESLVEVEVSIGLLLSDIADRLVLSP